MLRWLGRRMDWNHEQRANGLAGFIAFAALVILYLEAPPVPAGSGTIRINSVKSRALVLHSTAAPSSQVMASISESPSKTTDAAAAATSPAVSALQRKVAMLQQGRKFLENTPDYTAVFSKQELVGDQLLELQDIYLKCRHAPFSVYLRWLSGDVDREVLYVDGQNGGEMIVHGGGWKARLPSLSISPNSSLAMQESRYPVTKAGILGTLDIMLEIHAEDVAKDRLARSDQLADEEFDGRQCAAFLIEYRDAKLSPTYRKSITLIDKEWNVPLYTRNFGWPNVGETATGDELDEATLIEFYTFTEVEFRQQLATADFDRGNEEYLFK
ncbi:MAG: DUF1571 domain-containing protein [Planctomycetaceae bacterium]|nr:DUF1571 domain-containing protein [Planctomycetaceae bacterium]